MAKTRHIGPFEVGPVGFGSMNLSNAYGVPPLVENAERLRLAEVNAGVRPFDTAAPYGEDGIAL